MRYEMLNKDRVVAILEINKNFTGIVEVLGTIPYFIGDINAWLSNRTSPVGRHNVQYLMKLANIRNKEEYLKVTHGISLTDTLWFREAGNKISWDKISPYRNRFSRVISEICLNGNYKYNGELRSPSPDYKVSGSVDKCWKHLNGNIYLFKTAGECYTPKVGLRPYMEYYASQVAEAFIPNRHHYIKYGIKVAMTTDGFRKPYVYSPLMTTEEVGLLEYGDSEYKAIGLDELDRGYLSTDDRYILHEMIMLDSLILNCDRHDGNYGFLINNNSFEILGLAPIYDNDCSLGFDVSLQTAESMEDAYQEALLRMPKAGLGDYIEQARWAMTKSMFSKVQEMRHFHFKRLPKNIDVADDRIQFMEYIIHRQADRILQTYGR